ncbi:Protoporphyrinogen oxidase [Tuber magnatum]|uniref:Protoporphyrinogen oxidase n=1 Tax=Tuber magnatum TaxID=42249 RepID=A0A317SG05_9PEZI|nr:Protoporphyrinogen oxidase [Tuber magnatum]
MHPMLNPQRHRLLMLSSLSRASSICFSRTTHGHPRTPQRHLHRTTPTGTIESVAVLGSPYTSCMCGGITGLSAAWYLSKLAPSIPVTLYEKLDRLGGWLNTKRVESEDGTIQFEQGPRTIRPWTASGLVTIDMIRQLDLEKELILISKNTPAAKNRFIYFPDRLNQLPSSLLSVLLSPNLPVMKGVLTGILAEPFRKRRPADLTDESVGSFVSRRFNKALANNLVSAGLHGIYAGDIDQLSAKSLFPRFWTAEEHQGSLMKSALSNKIIETEDDQTTRAELHDDNVGICTRMEGTSVYSFKNGIEALSLALARELRESPNVTIKLGAKLGNIDYVKTQGLPINITEGGSNKPVSYSHVISTLFAPSLNSLLPTTLRSPSLASVQAVTVLVVNLYYRTPNLLPVQGFGYLIPKSVPGSENPEKALGVIFDSDTIPSPGTKVTVMMGGHYWQGRASYPDKHEAVKMARTVLRRHLRIAETPALTNATLQRDCIPQYTVGHDERMENAHEDLLTGFKGRLSVAGNSYLGVGLNDCVRNARDVVKGLLSGGSLTGLEGFKAESPTFAAHSSLGQTVRNTIRQTPRFYGISTRNTPSTQKSRVTAIANKGM